MSNREMPPLPSQSQASEKSEASAQESAKVKPQKIEVIALMKGFYKQRRIKEGQKFFIDSMDQLGSWMKCVDKTLAKRHEDKLSAEKLKARAVAQQRLDKAGE